MLLHRSSACHLLALLASGVLLARLLGLVALAL